MHLASRRAVQRGRYGLRMIRWGIAGPGGIAARFARAMTLVDDGRIVAVASRSAQRAAAFADQFDIAGRYDDYRALGEDPDVDAVYVATPHARHEADTLLYLEAGKHVLCEKPMALNAAQVRRMVDAAAASGTFLMEAVWSRFLPSYRALVDLVGSGRIGTPLQVEGTFGFRRPVDPTHRLFDLAQGGGALLDLGIYPIQLSTLVLGPIAQVAGSGVLGATGVDEQVAAVLRHERGGLGVVQAAITVPLACTARISGSDGWIDLPAFMHCPTSFTVTAGVSQPEVVDASFDGDGFEFEIAEVHRCLARGLTESPTMPLAETLALAGTMDAVRAQIGLTYPGE
jgi:predicted dehydrogenase